MAEGDQSAEFQPKSGANSVAIMVACVVIILAGMAWFVTYDWPSGKTPSVGNFIMFWLRELIVLGVAFVVLCALAVQKIRGAGKGGSKE